MDYRVDLLTNGMIEKYPNCVYMSNIKVKHWRELYLAGNTPNSEQTLTAVLDDLINFEKTEFIKSSDELTMADRVKLFFWQRINSKGPDYTITFTCPACKSKSVKNTFDLLKLREVKLNSKVKEKIIETDDFKIKLKIPTRLDLIKYEDFINEFKEKVYNKIKDLKDKESINKILKENYLMPIDIPYFIKKENLIKINNNDLEFFNRLYTEDKEDIEYVELNDSATDEDKNKLWDILIQTDIMIDEGNNLRFDDYTGYLISLYIVIENHPENFIEYMVNIDLKVVTEIEAYVKSFYHGMSNEVEFNCTKCHHKFKEELTLDPNFFLR